MSKACVYCSFFGECEDVVLDEEYCGSFSPVEGLTDDDYIDEIIEERRLSFRREWFEYINDV